MKTKLRSSSLRDMSEDDMKHIMVNTKHYKSTFKGMIVELKSLRTSISRMKSGKATKRDREKVRHFGYGYAGYDDLWNYYRVKNYRMCVEILDRDIAELRKKTNDARLKWFVNEGIQKEIVRRFHLK